MVVNARIFLLVPCLLWALQPTWAQTSVELMELSIEELMDIDVFSASKKEQKLVDVAAAVSVIERENLRRSGFTTIPEALRLAPGVQVGRVDANKWAITARGFNGRFANKQLVLVDGRSVYTPLFAGVFWQEQDLVMDDLERIEVIRGPGATLWGANAVNGVINIISRNAADTQGTWVRLGGGSEERAAASARHGGRLGENLHYRVYGKVFERDAFIDSTGRTAADGWRVGRGGFRLDWEKTVESSLSLQGGVYGGEVGQTYSLITSPQPPYREVFDFDTQFFSGHLMGRWQRVFSPQADLALQVYYDGHDLDDRATSETRHTVDVDFQHRWAPQERHEFIWGLGYRISHGETEGNFTFSYDPAARTDDIFSLFAQDDIEVVEERLNLIVGAKVERHDYVGFEWQPNMRFLWRVDARQRLWGSVARAVRMPAGAETRTRGVLLVSDTGGLVPGYEQGLATFFANEDFQSEELTAFELGYRVQPGEGATLDLAAFYNVYDQLRSVEPFLPYVERDPVPHLIIPLLPSNKLAGRVYGFEVEAKQSMSARWRLRGNYTLLQMDLDPDADSQDTFSSGAEGEVPEHQFALHSMVDLRQDLEFDLLGRYVDRLPQLGVEAYFDIDARLAWQPRPGWEIAVVGQNLLADSRAEFKPEFLDSLPTETQRGLYGTVTWRY